MIMAEDIEYLQLKLMGRIRSSEIVGPGYMKTSIAAAAARPQRRKGKLMYSGIRKAFVLDADEFRS